MGELQPAGVLHPVQHGPREETPRVPGVHRGPRDDSPLGADAQRPVRLTDGSLHAELEGAPAGPQPVAGQTRGVGILIRRATRFEIVGYAPTSSVSRFGFQTGSAILRYNC